MLFASLTSKDKKLQQVAISSRAAEPWWQQATQDNGSNFFLPKQTEKLYKLRWLLRASQEAVVQSHAARVVYLLGDSSIVKKQTNPPLLKLVSREVVVTKGSAPSQKTRVKPEAWGLFNNGL